MQLSKKLLVVAAGKTIVLPFTHDHGIGVKRNAGEIVNIMHVNRLPNRDSSELEEETGFPVSKLSWANRALQLKAYGEGVEYTDLMEYLMAFQPSNSIQKALATQMEEQLDTMAAQAFMDPTAVKVVYTPTTLTGGVVSVTGTPAARSTVPLTFDHCTAIVDYMRDTIHVPFYEGSNYVGLSCNKNMRALKNDQYWQMWHMYAQKVEFAYKGEMGMTEGIRWVEVNRPKAFSNVAGTSATLGEAVVFGDEAVARLEVLAPHLRLDKNFQNRFGTSQACAWYAILALGSVWDLADDGKAKIVRIDSL
jgi:N4-gp56 family major capsid protein